ncbi:hypothetical protein [Thalassospira xiamenensis]|uniref:Uncharacterized protein n=1 Tax=Thalassospira xiamenensis TaxID=220697 RepID=A0A285TT73_9PROT|nr:hypothetical protein [Thalassospira xiamenensis]SOC26305.1 hypothetical protein SAMN05428964_10594 [Thalassospira xiamenensis]
MNAVSYAGIEENTNVTSEDFGTAWRGYIGLGGLPGKVDNDAEAYSDEDFARILNMLGGALNLQAPSVLPFLENEEVFKQAVDWLLEFDADMLGDKYDDQFEAIEAYRLATKPVFDIFEKHRILVSKQTGYSAPRDLRPSEMSVDTLPARAPELRVM